MVAFIVAQGADLLTFLLAAQIHPVAGEANPIARFVYQESGSFGIILFKALIVTLVLLLAKGRNRSILFGVGVAVGVIGALSNTLAGVL